VDAVEVYGTKGMVLIDGQVPGPAVDLTGSGVNDPETGVEAGAAFQEAELRHGVQLRIPAWPLHAVGVADLARQIEDQIRGADMVLQRGGVGDVAMEDRDRVTDRFKVGLVGAAARDGGIDDGDAGAEFG